MKSNELFEMQKHALSIEKLELDKEFETMTFFDVELRKNGTDEVYTFSYNCALISGFTENFKDFSLEIMTMDEYRKGGTNCSTASLFCYGSSSMSFKSRKPFDIYTAYHIKVIPNSYIFKVCSQAVDLLKLFNMDTFFNDFMDPIRSKRNLKVAGNFRFFNKKIEKNREQAMAVISIVRRVAFPYPYVVFGPPGK